jgi:hypothetical protein
MHVNGCQVFLRIVTFPGGCPQIPVPPKQTGVSILLLGILGNWKLLELLDIVTNPGTGTTVGIILQGK